MANRISVFASRDLQTVIRGMKDLPREGRKQIRTQTKNMLQTEWRAALEKEAATTVERLVIARTGRVAVSDRNVTLRAGGGSRALSGGLVPSRDNRAVEFGGNRQGRSTYPTRSPLGRTYRATRRTKAQLPPFRRTGYVFYPAVANIAPRVAALWAQTWARGIYEAMRGR